MANLAMPGAGSLAAGRVVGYAQLVAAFVAFAITLTTTTHCLAWVSNHWAQMWDPSYDPTSLWGEEWRVFRWPLAGIGLYLLDMGWAAATSLRILRESRQQPGKLPPPLLPPRL